MRITVIITMRVRVSKYKSRIEGNRWLWPISYGGQGPRYQSHGESETTVRLLLPLQYLSVQTRYFYTFHFLPTFCLISNVVLERTTYFQQNFRWKVNDARRCSPLTLSFSYKVRRNAVFDRTKFRGFVHP